jgi:hypothetical protein
MNIEDKIVSQMITKYLNTLGNNVINEMTCSEVKYNFSIHIVNLYQGEERWEFSDSWRKNYDYIIVVDSDVPVPNIICNEYKEKYFKDERALEYPLIWAFKPEMDNDLKYMGIDLTSFSLGKAGLHFKNME